MNKIIITGGRGYDNKELFYEVLDRINPRAIASGDAQGADALVEEWIKSRERTDINYQVYVADWGSHNRSAGPIRNKKMLVDNTDGVVVAFPGGKGTMNCVGQAKEMGIPVLRVDD